MAVKSGMWNNEIIRYMNRRQASVQVAFNRVNGDIIKIVREYNKCRNFKYLRG